MACLLQGVASVLEGFLPIYSAQLGGTHQDSGAVVHTGDCTTHPIHPKYVLWGCSLVILQAAPSWGRCLAEGNQGLPEHSEVWCYRLGSGSYSAKCYRGAQEAIWHHCEKLPRRVLNHYQLGPYKPGAFAGSAHQVNDVP